MNSHDSSLKAAFDQQAEQFEQSPVSKDPQALDRLVAFAGLVKGTSVLDTGCGPGLVAEALLKSGCLVQGVDLSAEMIARARYRCEGFDDRAKFQQGSVFDPDLQGPFDAVISRFVLHHVEAPAAFLARQVELLRPGGVLILCDHTTDPNPARANWHQEIEKLRDHTHTRNQTPGQIVDLLAQSGLNDIDMKEDAFVLDFDAWFDRGSPVAEKPVARALLANGNQARGWTPEHLDDGSIRIHCRITMARGLKP